MKSPKFKNPPRLSLTSAVRLIERPANTELQAPDFDEHGFPVMSGVEDFYASLTNNSRDKIVAMTFEPQTNADIEGIKDKTFFVKITEQLELLDQLLLKLANDFVICQSDERMQFPEAQVFGVVALSAEGGGRGSEKAAAHFSEEEPNTPDEFDQTRRTSKLKATLPPARRLAETKLSPSDDETEYDYDADFGA